MIIRYEATDDFEIKLDDERHNRSVNLVLRWDKVYTTQFMAYPNDKEPDIVIKGSDKDPVAKIFGLDRRVIGIISKSQFDKYPLKEVVIQVIN